MSKFPSTLTLAHTIWDTKGKAETLLLEMPNTDCMPEQQFKYHEKHWGKI